MTKLYLVTENHEQPEPLDDHEINLNRIDSTIETMSCYEDMEDPYYFLLASAMLDIIKAKHLYLAWVEEQY